VGSARPNRHVPGTGVPTRLCAPVPVQRLLLGFLWLNRRSNNNPVPRMRWQPPRTRRPARVSCCIDGSWCGSGRGPPRSILRELVGSDPTLRAQAVEDLRAEQVLDAAFCRYRRADPLCPGRRSSKRWRSKPTSRKGPSGAGEFSAVGVHRSLGTGFSRPPDRPAAERTAAHPDGGSPDGGSPDGGLSPSRNAGRGFTSLPARSGGRRRRRGDRRWTR